VHRFVGGTPLLPVIEGVISCRCLGARSRRTTRAATGDRRARRARHHGADAEHAGRLLERPGRQPLPRGYFDVYPGVWRHGDWITIAEDGSCVITGRSDATLNRGGVRLGTAEFYSWWRSVAGSWTRWSCTWTRMATTSCCCSWCWPTASSSDAGLRDRIRAEPACRAVAAARPRRDPSVRAVPRTLSAKKLEVPVKRILTGIPADRGRPGARWPIRSR
jgi:acetoacetyl-CoA synthetase